MTLPKEVLERIRSQAKSYQEDPSFEVGYETGAIREAERAEKFKRALEASPCACYEYTSKENCPRCQALEEDK